MVSAPESLPQLTLAVKGGSVMGGGIEACMHLALKFMSWVIYRNPKQQPTHSSTHPTSLVLLGARAVGARHGAAHGPRGHASRGLLLLRGTYPSTYIPINGSHVFRSILVPTTRPAVVVSVYFHPEGGRAFFLPLLTPLDPHPHPPNTLDRWPPNTGGRARASCSWGEAWGSTRSCPSSTTSPRGWRGRRGRRRAAVPAAAAVVVGRADVCGWGLCGTISQPPYPSISPHLIDMLINSTGAPLPPRHRGPGAAATRRRRQPLVHLHQGPGLEGPHQPRASTPPSSGRSSRPMVRIMSVRPPACPCVRWV